MDSLNWPGSFPGDLAVVCLYQIYQIQSIFQTLDFLVLGRQDVPGVYVKVSSFIGWINQIISVNNL